MFVVILTAIICDTTIFYEYTVGAFAHSWTIFAVSEWIFLFGMLISSYHACYAVKDQKLSLQVGLGSLIESRPDASPAESDTTQKTEAECEKSLIT